MLRYILPYSLSPMSQIQQMMDITSTFVRDLDRVDIEYDSDGSEALVYVAATGKGKSIAFRKSISPKRKKSGVRQIKYKRESDILDSIYSWCGFEWVEIKFDLCTKVSSERNVEENETYTLKYTDTIPGWLNLRPIPVDPWMVITITYVPKIHIPSPHDYIMIKSIMLEASKRAEFEHSLEDVRKIVVEKEDRTKKNIRYTREQMSSLSNV
jgi:hypothetical protein